METIFAPALHPYTHGLMQSIPRVDQNVDRLIPIEGSVPSALELPSGCTFRTRCPNALERCAERAPPLDAVGEDHMIACYNPVSRR